MSLFPTQKTIENKPARVRALLENALCKNTHCYVRIEKVTKKYRRTYSE